jgi:predicted metal-dependent peptidase
MRDVVFPGMIGSDPRISVAVDTSGSMRPNELSSALDEVSGILKTVSHSSKGSIVFFCVDTKMKDVQTVSDPHDLKLSGGGGTNMAPAFRYIKELKRGKRPDVFILITDGGFNWDESLEVWPSQTSVIVLLTKRNELDTLQKLLNGKAKIIDISD